MPKVSVIIPVYNCEEYLYECFSSIERQTFGLENIEVIIVNDGSTDHSEEIIKQHCHKHKLWTSIMQENRGISYARNIAMERVSTHYILFLDSDDYLEDNAIENLYDAIVKNKVGLVIGRTRCFDSKGTYKYYTDKILTKEKVVTYKKFKKITESIALGGKIFDKSIIKNTKFILNAKHEDIYFSLKIFLQNCNVYLMNKVVYNRRLREGKNRSIMQSLNYDTYQDLITNYKKVIEECEADGKLTKRIIEKLNKYIAKNLKSRDIKKAQNDCMKFLNSIKKINQVQITLLKCYCIVCNIMTNIYVAFIRNEMKYE